MDAADPAQAASESHRDEGAKDDADPKKTNIRKRTKTGCITCRKRRIKCDEQHPECRNCIKSKRTCEGYAKKLGWKPPLGQNTYGDDHHARDASLQAGYFPNQPRASPQGPLPFIAPRPLGPLPSAGASGSLPTPFGQHQVDGDARYQDYPELARQPLPNPLLHGSGQVSSATARPDHQAASQYNRGSGPTTHQPQWVAPNVHFSQSSRHAQQRPEQSWDPAEMEELASDVSMADSDDDEDRLDDLALARAQTQTDIWPSANMFMGPSGTYGRPNILSVYMGSPHLSIFQSAELRRVFRQFIETTGPAISLYERPPYRCPEGAGDYSLWSYTLPANALKHPSLLHAILALGSLQYSNLRGQSTWTAMKQYHLSIRRLSKNLSNPAGRTRISTLAATLLLGYFEVYQSEHASWCNHLFGASILLSEMPIVDMTRRCLAAKRLRSTSQFEGNFNPADPFGFPQPPNAKALDELDYELLSDLTGAHITAEQYGLADGQPVDDAILATTDKDIENYETLRDLVWWYNKLDVYQSFLGGSKLLRAYDLWTMCPPRAHMCDEEAIYGTYDHVILLLGRLANFAAKDLVRKRKAASASPQPKGGSPQFPGIVPTGGKVTAPRGFSTTASGKSPQSQSNEESNLDISIKDALREWETIRAAFAGLKEQMDRTFTPLPDGYADRRESPFGPPIQYRSYAMAGIWMNFYMGMIQLHRCHPNMPPAAMPAAHMAEQNTREYAVLIGRMAAGLSIQGSNWPGQRIDVNLAAAYVECSFCLFVAAVQYKDNAQRHWSVRRVLDIVQLVGWKSGTQIANALEAGWTKVAQMGRGPPYTRAQDLGSMPRPWENPRRVDRFIVKGQNLGDESRVTLANPGRANLALGLIGIEDDLAVLELDE
ncbi:hypothetical protein NLU13_0567 [Sarocladium strictum]|uniref:Zn(2)-C6 fungal-type domain-containing protein n=1 Tax=Sarocladium strictum TaxID=5046 RepID=A0AA39GPA4_SARSR|nr:hypothetical protein NLU13_0567 [Sarocladium strictum]